jgi:predicted thioesterase
MMTRDPTIDATANVEMIVRHEDTAAAISPVTGESYPAVLATTRCIALCELAAGRILVPLLARYTGREGKLYSFDVVVEDPAGECMRGVHKRAVIEEKRLLEGARKRGP